MMFLGDGTLDWNEKVVKGRGSGQDYDYTRD